MGVLVLIDNPSVLELYIEVLIYRMEDSSDGEVVLQLHRHFLPHQLLEIREEELRGKEEKPFDRMPQGKNLGYRAKNTTNSSNIPSSISRER